MDTLFGNYEPLREMQISNAEFRTFDMDWQKRVTATTKILDVAIS